MKVRRIWLQSRVQTPPRQLIALLPDRRVDITGGPGSPGGDGALTVRTEMEPLEELTIATHGRGELVSGSVKVVSNGPLESVLDIPVFLNHRENAEACLNQRCIKKDVPESSRPTSSSHPLTLQLEDERSNRPSESSAANNPVETGSTQPGLSAIETHQQSEDRRFA